LSQNFRSHNTCSDGLTGTAANWLEPGYFSQGEKSVVILPNLKHMEFLPFSDETSRVDFFGLKHY